MSKGLIFHCIAMPFFVVYLSHDDCVMKQTFLHPAKSRAGEILLLLNHHNQRKSKMY